MLNENELATLTYNCENLLDCNIGTRNLLQHDWVRHLALKIRNHAELQRLLPDDALAIQCNYFNKNITDNWYVTLHRDLSIPVANKIDSGDWSGWSLKEGVLYAQPPRHVLESLLIVRVHLEDNNHENGALCLVPGSHLADNSASESIVCDVNLGGALVMRPLVLHKSSKLKNGQRRVLHFVFGPSSLPDGAKWP